MFNGKMLKLGGKKCRLTISSKSGIQTSGTGFRNWHSVTTSESHNIAFRQNLDQQFINWMPRQVVEKLRLVKFQLVKKKTLKRLCPSGS